MQKQSTDDFACFLCDYGLYLLAALIILVTFLLSRTGVPVVGPSIPHVSGGSQASLPDLPKAIPTVVPGTATALPVSTQWTATAAGETMVTRTAPAGATPIPKSTAAHQQPTEPGLQWTATVALTPSPEASSPPEYVIAFVPVNWSGTHEAFIAAAKKQGDFFIHASGLDQYFKVTFLYFEEEYTQTGLDDPKLLDNLLVFAIGKESADRYVGLTDGDLSPEGRSWVAGYTYGIDTQGILAETGEETISAHELGHTYGLCDEYNYSAWNEQDQETAGGCPNPYPPACRRDTGAIDECAGTKSLDGKLSLMAAAGPPEMSAYNEPSLNHLHQVFENLSGGSGNR